MPVSLLNEWGAFIQDNPLIFNASYKQKRQDWNAAMIATVIRNVIAFTRYKNPKALEIADVMFKQAPSAPAQKSPTEIYALFKTAVIAYTAAADKKNN